MNRNLKNALAVFYVTVFTAIAVYATVTFAGTVSGTGTTASDAAYASIAEATYSSGGSSGGTLTCPRTGCTASSCHATQ